ncbi:hypothetical protein KIN20_003287 [Parelaphostrongylus tenuis]|uniref:Uncharacterized protein n=1 Tax=Parelaphostrongylus tenuis TaxID=148309 RepID=A0AAD5QFY4_PARTN|nr:hypothetical protein KIN20_003287 [Parelaphostrongylus tenuis]
MSAGPGFDTIHDRLIEGAGMPHICLHEVCLMPKIIDKANIKYYLQCLVRYTFKQSVWRKTCCRKRPFEIPAERVYISKVIGTVTCVNEVDVRTFAWLKMAMEKQ